MTILPSLLIAEAHYDAKEQALRLMFVNEKESLFEEVPEHIYEQLVDAPSAGSFYTHYIRDRYRRRDSKNGILGVVEASKPPVDPRRENQSLMRRLLRRG